MARSINVRKKPDIEMNSYRQLVSYVDTLVFDFEAILNELKGYPTEDLNVSKYREEPDVHRMGRTYEFQSGGAVNFLVELIRGYSDAGSHPLILIDINISGSYELEEDNSKFSGELEQYIKRHSMERCKDLSARNGLRKNNLLPNGDPRQDNEAWAEDVTLGWLKE